MARHQSSSGPARHRHRGAGASRLLSLAVVGTLAVSLALTSTPAGASTTLVGAWSVDWKWFDANVGQQQIYRGYDTGFAFATWQDTVAYQKHPGASASDYSFQVPPQQLANPLDLAVQAEVTTFVASTPKNIVLSNYHEPEQEIEDGLFTLAQFRAATVRLNQIVDAQNFLDGGTRQVSVILMVSTFTGFKGRNANNYWPTQSADGGTADVISADAYALPHATGTSGVPLGYTDGVGWKSATTLLNPVRKFAVSKATPWAVSELGYLEDVHDPMRKANALSDAVAYAKANGALFIEVWDSKGGRADWKVRYNNPPVPSTSGTSKAAVMWKQLSGAA